MVTRSAEKEVPCFKGGKTLKEGSGFFYVSQQKKQFSELIR